MLPAALHNLVLILGVVAMAAAVPAHAQEHRPNETAASNAASNETVSLDVIYTADIWHATAGGLKNGTRYLDNFDILVSADLEALLGWEGATAFVYGLYNNGQSLNALMGDAQVSSNIDTGVKAARLYEAWIDQRFANDVASLKVGLYDLNSEFDALDTSALFVGSAHGIGTDISQTGANGPSIFPVTSLAARLAIEPSEHWTLRMAVLDGVPGDPARPKRTTIKLGDRDGALLVGEVEYKTSGGNLLAGYWHYTAEFDHSDHRRSRGNNGVYIRGEAQLTRETDHNQGLAGFFRLGVADGRINMFDRFTSAGLSYAGLFPGRDADLAGVAVAAAFTSADYRRRTPADTAEIVFELTYRAPIADFLTIQPNLQYVVSPGTDPAVRDALAIGLRTEIGFRF